MARQKENDYILMHLLRGLDKQADEMREHMDLPQRGEVIWAADIDIGRKLLVTADGYGKATTSEVEGNYPADYISHWGREFETEDEACAFARHRIAGGGADEAS